MQRDTSVQFGAGLDPLQNGGLSTQFSVLWTFEKRGRFRIWPLSKLGKFPIFVTSISSGLGA